VRLIGELGASTSRRFVDHCEIDVSWDQDRLDYPAISKLRNRAINLMQSFPAKDRLTISFDNMSFADEYGPCILFALDFPVLPGAEGTVDFLITDADVGDELSGGLISVEGFPLQ